MKANNISLSRRSFFRLSLAFGLVSNAGIMGKAFARSSSGDMTLVLLGTQGGPNYNLVRGESASVVLVDDQPYLIDCGYGTLRALKEARVSFLDIAQVFLTHLHDDHSADVVSLLGHQWTQGRVASTLVYGPYGTDELVKAAIRYNRANTEIRMLDEGRSVKPEDLFSGHVISATQKPNKVFEDARIVVHAIENTHLPEGTRQQIPYRSLSYRIDSERRSMVFSGDTNYSDNLISLAKNTDVFVCETIHVASMRRAFDRMIAAGKYADNPEGVWKHIVATHTSTEDAGRMANAAGVKLLVLNHLIPGALQDVQDSLYLEGVRKHYQGEVVIGKDLLRL